MDYNAYSMVCLNSLYISAVPSFLFFAIISRSFFLL